MRVWRDLKNNSKGEAQVSEYQFCKVEKKNHILTLTINRPDRRNAVHPPASEEFSAVLDEFAADPDLWVGIITGAGDKAFSAGNDLKFQMENQGKVRMPATGFAGITSRFDLDKPMIAAVNGVAMGGGFEIALACDIIVASDNAVFALPEPRVGLAALAGGLHRLPREIGLKRAMGMILTGRHVSAQEGQELGFVNKIVPQAQLMEEAHKQAEMILACSPVSIRASKRAIRDGLEAGGVAAALTSQNKAIGKLMQSEDQIEGVRAFVEKRPPQWKGR